MRFAIAVMALFVPGISLPAYAYGPVAHAEHCKTAKENLPQPYKSIVNNFPGLFIAGSEFPDSFHSTYPNFLASYLIKHGLDPATRPVVNTGLHNPYFAKALLEHAMANQQEEVASFALGWVSHLMADMVSQGTYPAMKLSKNRFPFAEYAEDLCELMLDAHLYNKERGEEIISGMDALLTLEANSTESPLHVLVTVMNSYYSISLSHTDLLANVQFYRDALNLTLCEKYNRAKIALTIYNIAAFTADMFLYGAYPNYLKPSSYKDFLKDGYDDLANDALISVITLGDNSPWLTKWGRINYAAFRFGTQQWYNGSIWAWFSRDRNKHGIIVSDFWFGKGSDRVDLAGPQVGSVSANMILSFWEPVANRKVVLAVKRDRPNWFDKTQTKKTFTVNADADDLKEGYQVTLSHSFTVPSSTGLYKDDSGWKKTSGWIKFPYYYRDTKYTRGFYVEAYLNKQGYDGDEEFNTKASRIQKWFGERTYDRYPFSLRMDKNMGSTYTHIQGPLNFLGEGNRRQYVWEDSKP